MLLSKNLIRWAVSFGLLYGAVAWASVAFGAEKPFSYWPLEKDVPIPSAEESLPRPKPQHLAYQDLEMGWLVCLANSYDKNPLTKVVDPETLDCRQWAKAAKAGGFKYGILCAKHHNGHCLWFSRFTDFRVQKRDVLREFVDAFRAEGLKVGVYVSPADQHHHPKTKNATDAQILSREETMRKNYKEFFKNQLAELLTNYGEMSAVWFDGNGNPFGSNPEINQHIRKLQPKALISMVGPDIRYIGEGGVANPELMSIYSLKAPRFRGELRTKEDLLSISPDGQFVWYPAEGDIPLDGWFGGKNPVSPKRVMEMYYGTVGRNANLLLGVAVESDGLVHENSVKVLEEFGAELKRRFGASEAETAGRGKEVVLKFDTATSIDHVVLMEDIAESERVRKYVVEADVDGSGGWKDLAGGSSIGHKKILQVEPIYVSAVRLRVIESVGEPQIRKLAVYNVGDREEWGQQEQTGKRK